MNFSRITPRLILLFFLISPLPLAGLAELLIYSVDSFYRQSQLNAISTLADKKTSQVNAYINECTIHAGLLAQTSEVIDILHRHYDQASLRNPIPDRLAGNELQTDYFHNYLSNAGYYDLLLIDLAGNVVSTIKQEADLGTNLNTGPYRNTDFAQSYREVMTLLETQISSVESYEPSAGRPTIFFISPVFDAGKLIGVLALQLDMEKFTVVTDDMTGLGKTGETILAQQRGDQVLFVSPMRRIEYEPFHYWLTQDKLTIPMKQAITGNYGVGIEKDFSDVEVVAAWRYLPALRWGMVVKMDVDEAFASINQLYKFILLMLLSIMLLSCVAAIWLGRDLLMPVQRLIETTKRIVAGEWDRRAALQGCFEFQQLALAFNSMTDHLQESHQNLEKQVAARTAEIGLALSQLNDAQHIAQVGSWELDLMHNILVWSDEIFYLFEIDKKRFPATYEAFLAAIHPDDRELVNNAYLASLQTRQPYEITHRLLMADGRIKYVTERCSSYFDDAGQPIRSIGTVQDVTQLKLAEMGLKQLNEELEHRVQQRTELLSKAKDEADRANRAKSEFLSRMSHELRTPMNAIIGFSQLLETDREEPLTINQRDNVEEISRAGQHLLALINEILDLARIETGRIELSLEPVEVLPVISECITLLQPLAAERHIRLQYHGGGSVNIEADRLRLRQVLLNLLSNAIKYNRDGGLVDINVEPGKYCGDSSAWVRVSVSDTGVGIAEHFHDRLFQPFERLGSAYEAIEGTGIGLALSKKLVEIMGGAIGMESVVGEGSVFWLELPAVSVKDYCPESESLSVTSIVGPESSKTVLYIEDNPANQRLISKIISVHTRCSLLLAANAEEGIVLAVNSQPDLILLDINLPGMNGFEALARLQQNPATKVIPVVALSANAMERDVKKGLAAGFVEYLTKPLDVNQFLTVLQQLLKQDC